jgi:hypothetical protein
LIETWRTFIEVCEEKHIDPGLVVWPKQYKEYQQVAARISVIREMKKRGVLPKQIKCVCPVEERSIYRILGDKRGVTTDHLKGQN